MSCDYFFTAQVWCIFSIFIFFLTFYVFWKSQTSLCVVSHQATFMQPQCEHAVLPTATVPLRGTDGRGSKERGRRCALAARRMSRSSSVLMNTQPPLSLFAFPLLESALPVV